MASISTDIGMGGNSLTNISKLNFGETDQETGTLNGTNTVYWTLGGSNYTILLAE